MTKEEIKAYNKKRYNEKGAKIRAQHVEYYLKNKKERDERSLKYYHEERKFTTDYRYSYYKRNAKKKERSFEITFEQFELLLQKSCFVAGCSRQVTGLDRIDSSTGYILNNVRPSCVRHNVMKSDMLDNEAYQVAKDFVTWYESL